MGGNKTIIHLATDFILLLYNDSAKCSSILRSFRSSRIS